MKTVDGRGSPIEANIEEEEVLGVDKVRVYFSDAFSASPVECWIPFFRGHWPPGQIVNDAVNLAACATVLGSEPTCLLLSRGSGRSENMYFPAAFTQSLRNALRVELRTRQLSRWVAVDDLK